MQEIAQLKQQIADLEAEAEEIELQDGGKKVSLNGTFGKLFSRYSIFYAPEFGIAVTIGGQLSLLMLIERLELSGIKVVSANTDGIEMLVPQGYDGLSEQVMSWWQSVTSLGLDTKSYLSLHSRDVNNYISIQFDGTVKRKGVFGESGVLNNKHPDCDICADAVVAFLSKGTPLQDTIYECQDIRKFVRVRGAKGGARLASGVHDPVAAVALVIPAHRGAKGGARLASGVHDPVAAVRWYYKRDCGDWIVDVASGNKVAGSDGACTVMQLPAARPDDINFPHYMKIAEDMLNDIGFDHMQA